MFGREFTSYNSRLVGSWAIHLLCAFGLFIFLFLYFRDEWILAVISSLCILLIDNTLSVYSRGTHYQIVMLRRELWAYTLAHRLFVQELARHTPTWQHLDIGQMWQDAQNGAIEDVKLAEDVPPGVFRSILGGLATHLFGYCVTISVAAGIACVLRHYAGF